MKTTGALLLIAAMFISPAMVILWMLFVREEGPDLSKWAVLRSGIAGWIIGAVLAIFPAVIGATVVDNMDQSFHPNAVFGLMICIFIAFISMPAGAYLMRRASQQTVSFSRCCIILTWPTILAIVPWLPSLLIDLRMR